MSPATGNGLVALYRSVKDQDSTTYVVARDFSLVRTNEAWTRFALANHGEAVLARWTVGRSILDAMTGELREFYRTAFERALVTGERWEHDYECSSSELFRTYRMFVFPLKSSGLVVSHSLRVEEPHERLALAASGAYRREGVITMCASCRRVRALEPSEHWDWVPAYVRELPAETSHGLCPPCAKSYPS
jgi:hypothetical protein